MVTGWALKKWLKSEQKSFLVMELPDYLKPDFKAVGITVWQNVHSFIWNEGTYTLLYMRKQLHERRSLVWTASVVCRVSLKILNRFRIRKVLFKLNCVVPH